MRRGGRRESREQEEMGRVGEGEWMGRGGKGGGEAEMGRVRGGNK